MSGLSGLLTALNVAGNVANTIGTFAGAAKNVAGAFGGWGQTGNSQSSGGGEDIRAMRVIVGEGVTQRWGWCCSHEMRSLPDRKHYDASILVEDEQQRNQYIPRWEWKRYSTPISPMYGTRERPITLAYAEGYTLRGGTL